MTFQTKLIISVVPMRIKRRGAVLNYLVDAFRFFVPRRVTWRVERDLVYRYSDKKLIIVRAGFVTDFASVPRFLWWFLPPVGEHTEAAVVHDWLYYTGDLSRVKADAVFDKIMREKRTPRWRRILNWWGVRVGGGFAWAQHRRRRIDRFVDLHSKAMPPMGRNPSGESAVD